MSKRKPMQIKRLFCPKCDTKQWQFYLIKEKEEIGIFCNSCMYRLNDNQLMVEIRKEMRYSG